MSWFTTVMLQVNELLTQVKPCPGLLLILIPVQGLLFDNKTKISKVLGAINLQSWLDLVLYTAVLLNHSQIQAFICASFYSFSPTKLLLSFKHFPNSFGYQIYGVFCKCFPISIHFTLSRWWSKNKATSV